MSGGGARNDECSRNYPQRPFWIARNKGAIRLRRSRAWRRFGPNPPRIWCSKGDGTGSALENVDATGSANYHREREMCTSSSASVASGEFGCLVVGGKRSTDIRKVAEIYRLSHAVVMSDSVRFDICVRVVAGGDVRVTFVTRPPTSTTTFQTCALRPNVSTLSTFLGRRR